MKKNNVIGSAIVAILCLLILPCCRFSPFPSDGKSLHNTVLKTITDTMTANPDAALDMIVSLSDTLDETHLSKTEYYEYQILVAEALYKNDFRQTNDSAVTAAAVFYDSLALKYPKNIDVIFYKARAHYYKGVGEQERELAAEAFGDFLSALEALDMINYEKEERYDIRHFKALTYNRLAGITRLYEINNISIELYSLANEIYLKEKMFNSLAKGKYQIALIYNKINEDSLAFLSIFDADSLLTLSGREDIRLSECIARTKAMILYNNGMQDEARVIILSLINSSNEETSMISCGMLADIYYNESQYDSAIYYYERYFGMHKFSRMDAARRIIEICNITGDKEKAAQYAPYLAEDTADEIALTSVKNEIVAAYGRYLADREVARKSHLWRTLIAVLVCITVVITIAAMVFGTVRRRRHKREIAQRDTDVFTLTGKVCEAAVANDAMQQRIESLEGELEMARRRDVPFGELMERLLENRVCRHVAAIRDDSIIKTANKYPEYELNEREQRRLIDAVDSVFGDFTLKMRHRHPRLTADDSVYLCLYLIGLDERHAAAVTGKTYNAVWNRSKRLHEIFGSEKEMREIMRDEISARL
ncbi:MAG: hypothetical protein MJZ56_07820 [Bacteroidales bacterium]|nr:hypothetical protein [Bacteroidales bacterium]